MLGFFVKNLVLYWSLTKKNVIDYCIRKYSQNARVDCNVPSVHFHCTVRSANVYSFIKKYTAIKKQGIWGLDGVFVCLWLALDINNNVDGTRLCKPAVNNIRTVVLFVNCTTYIVLPWGNFASRGYWKLTTMIRSDHFKWQQKFRFNWWHHRYAAREARYWMKFVEIDQCGSHLNDKCLRYELKAPPAEHKHENEMIRKGRRDCIAYKTRHCMIGQELGTTGHTKNGIRISKWRDVIGQWSGKAQVLRVAREEFCQAMASDINQHV